MTNQALRFGAVVAVALSLGGCVSLLPKAKPASLYRLGADDGAPVASPAMNARGVSLAPVEFPREAVTDGILTVEGSQTSYLAGARWIAPAPILFRQALNRSFDTSAPGVNLMSRGELGRSTAILELDVERFEAHYTGPGAPTIRVTVRAKLAAANGVAVAAQTFDASVPASENGARAIVAAYNQATGQALVKLAGWVDQNAPALPPPPASTSTTTSTTSTSVTTRQP